MFFVGIFCKNFYSFDYGFTRKTLRLNDVLNLEGNIEAMNVFWNICFTNFLASIEMQETSSCALSSVKEEYAEIARNNTEVTRALRLPFKGIK